MRIKNRKLLLIVCIAVGIALIGGLFIYYSQSTIALNIYESIPEKPGDFAAYKRDVQSGQLFDVCSLESKYWKQPEWYGESWDRGRKQYYDKSDYGRWGVWGHGSMPSEIGYQAENMKEGNELEVCNFFHTGWGVWTWQGFELELIDNEYFEVNMEPKQIMLTPTFPIFEDGWVKRVRLNIKAKKDIPPGDYVVGYKVTSPNSDKSNEWTKEVLNMRYGNKQKYIDKCEDRLGDKERCIDLINNRQKKFVDGSSYQTERPLLEVHINVK